MTDRATISGGPKSRAPDAAAAPKHQPKVPPVRSSETARQERAQGGQPQIPDSADPMMKRSVP